MRIARIAAFAFTALCLVIAGVDLLGSRTMKSGYGPDPYTLDCGSPAFPKAAIDLDPAMATNCVGETPAPLALYSVLLAGVGLGVVGITSRRGTARVGTARAARMDATA